MAVWWYCVLRGIWGRGIDCVKERIWLWRGWRLQSLRGACSSSLELHKLWGRALISTNRILIHTTSLWPSFLHTHTHTLIRVHASSSSELMDYPLLNPTYLSVYLSIWYFIQKIFRLLFRVLFRNLSIYPSVCLSNHPVRIFNIYLIDTLFILLFRIFENQIKWRYTVQNYSDFYSEYYLKIYLSIHPSFHPSRILKKSDR